MGMAYRESSYAVGVFDYYLFTKNLQGDIISIYNTSGTCVASYTYNAWGEHTVTNHTNANIGRTIFNDNHGWKSYLMWVSYLSKGLIIWGVDLMIH